MEGLSLEPMRLYGFNNLTKSLSFNFYGMAYVDGPVQREAYWAYIEEQYNTERLVGILSKVAAMIGASILNVARQDYEPQGSSITMTVGDNSLPNQPPPEKTPGFFHRSDDVVMHLDKSHLTVHTYPESHPDNGINTFRTDIEVSTCGRITPLKALNYLIRSFESDIVTLDYRVRGFTRDTKGNKYFIDHEINSMQNFMAADISQYFQMVDVNLHQESIFHTKMLLKSFEIGKYLFEEDRSGYSDNQLSLIEQRLRKEMSEIFQGRVTGTL